MMTPKKKSKRTFKDNLIYIVHKRSTVLSSVKPIILSMLNVDSVPKIDDAIIPLLTSNPTENEIRNAYSSFTASMNNLRAFLDAVNAQIEIYNTQIKAEEDLKQSSTLRQELVDKIQQLKAKQAQIVSQMSNISDIMIEKGNSYNQQVNKVSSLTTEFEVITNEYNKMHTDYAEYTTGALFNDHVNNVNNILKDEFNMPFYAILNPKKRISSDALYSFQIMDLDSKEIATADLSDGQREYCH